MKSLKAIYFQKYNVIWGMAFALFFMIGWEAAFRFKILNPIFISSPSEIFGVLPRMFVEDQFATAIMVSLQETILGLSLAIFIGIFMGIIMGWYRFFSAFLGPFVNAFNSTPRIALLPLFIIWFGLGMEAKVVIIFLSALFPMLVNTQAGFSKIDPNLIRVARAFGANDFVLLATVGLPSAFPYMLAGLRLAIARGLVGMVVAEMFAGQQGLGYVIAIAGATLQTSKLMASVAFVALFGIVMTELVRIFEKRFASWG